MQGYIVSIITFFFLMSSCGNIKQENKDIVIEQLIDSLNTYRELGNGKRMLSMIDSLKKMNVDMPNIAMEYAVAYAYLGDFDKSIKVLKDSIEVSSKPQLLYNELGSIYRIKGDTVEAIIAYKQAINYNQNYARPYINLAELYNSKKDKELAVNNYMEAVRLFAEFEHYEEMGSYASKVHQLDSTNVDANKFLQYYWYKEGDYRMALAIGLEIDELCVKQNRLEEGYANMYFMGMILFDMGQYAKSISLMHQASENEMTAKEYGYSICCYVSASYRKLDNNEKADYFLDLAKKVNLNEAEEYINELLKREHGDK